MTSNLGDQFGSRMEEAGGCFFFWFFLEISNLETSHVLS